MVMSCQGKVAERGIIEHFIIGDKPIPFALSLSKGKGASAGSARTVS
jgi:hypothetical protein